MGSSIGYRRKGPMDGILFVLICNREIWYDGWNCDNAFAYVRVFEASLCMFVHKFEGNSEACEVWVMKDYGVIDSWTKVLAISSNINRVPSC